MSGDQSIPTKKKIVGLRTFADDVKRVRGVKNTEETQPVTEPVTEKITEAKQEKEVNSKPKAEKTQSTNIASSKAQEKTNPGSQNALDITLDDNVEIPPFHYIRASSPEDTNFDNPEEIPDKKSLKRDTITKKHAPLQKNIPTETLNLQDEISAVSNQQQPPELGSTSAALNVNIAEEGITEGTIVTDQKHKRFRLFPAVAASLKNWFSVTRSNIEHAQSQQPPKTKIRKSTQRKDVITKAAEQTRRAPQDDYAVIKERLRNVDRNTLATTEVSIKKKTDVDTQEWSTEKTIDPITSESQEVLAATYSYDSPDKNAAADSIEELESMIRGDSTTPVYTKESIQIPETKSVPEAPETISSPNTTETNATDHTPAEHSIQKTDSVPVGYGSLPEYESPEIQPPTPETQTNETTPIQTAPSSIALEMETATQPEEAVAFLRDDVIARPREENTDVDTGGYREYREQYGDTYTPKEEAFLENLSPQTTPPVEPEPAPQLATSPIPESRTAWAQQKRRTTNTQRQARAGTPFIAFIAVVIVATLLGSSASIWWFTRDTQTTTTPETTAQTKNTLPLLGDAHAFLTQVKTTTTSLGNDITYLTPVIGNTPASSETILETLQISADGSFTRNITNIQFGSNKNNPFIVLTVASFDTAFGGILLWESSIPKDLSPLFENAVQTAGKDIRISNNDARVLTDEVGREIVIYGFVDKQTILIAPTRDVFIEVLQSLR